ncbi:hypothetical protein [Prosthecochloris sp. HL-130-GSB]|jgi:hypothetical protein|uniref:Acg family FMN-binding oxidoreductase n=1 Tax=Prosthecochloris sp. HL-130-GSB TaxID=1974213 RepID=UPI001E4C2073|nr:hypothetical protein [Prosthecochloris sp. HL-130-GSB]
MVFAGNVMKLSFFDMTISRRTFLVRMAQVAVVGGLLPGLAGCDGLVRDDLERGEGYDALLATLGEQRAGMLLHASLAPSSHNVQPWTVSVVDNDHWVIGIADRRRLPAVDPRNREILLSIGAFAENLVLAGGAFGLSCRTRLISDDPYASEVLEVRLEQARSSGYPLSRLLQRRTLRSAFDTREIEAADFSHLVEGDEGFFYFPSASRESNWLDNATIEANRQQVKRSDVQQELASWIRWSDAAAARHRNGLTPEAMGITGLAGWYVRNFYGRDDVFNKDFRKNTVNRVISQVSQGGGWIVVTGRDHSNSSLIDAGRRFQRMFLRAREKSVGIHPMSQVLEESPWNEKARASLGLPGEPHFLIRTGYSRDYPLPVSLRMPLDRLVSIKPF